MKAKVGTKRSGPLAAVPGDLARIVHSIVAREFSNRRGHGNAPYIVCRQLTRQQLTELLAECAKDTALAMRRRIGGA